MKPQLLSLFVLLLALGGGCQPLPSEQAIAPPNQAGPVGSLPTPKEGFVKVQHILVGFSGSVQGKEITRTREEAEKLTAELVEKAKSGADFDQLVSENTDDAAPGIYVMADLGVDTKLYPGTAYRRGGMVTGFGDVAFSLNVGEIGVAEYDATKSPYGWHIVKRLE
jgi:hypothetical protein